MKLRPEFYEEWLRPVIAEFIGQVIFVFMHMCGANTNLAVGTALAPALTDGFTVALIINLFGHISGAHVNFAVTIAVFLAGGIKLKMVLPYLVFQILGSLAGAGLAYVVNGRGTGAFSLGYGVSVERGLLLEVVTTTVLTLTAIITGVQRNSILASVAVGFSVIIAILGGFNISGAAMNPILSLGPAVASSAWDNYWIYWVGPLIGACVSGTLYRLVLADKARLYCRRHELDPQDDASDYKLEKEREAEMTEEITKV
ncbi:unnamed protein product [Clavelina lepadiformis]|uniref:Uncharacterized protein n=1 Tax=Clavelina lepadiformis TaxID=159417 RepID=A0ABP0F1A3_CLALP